MLFRLYDLIVYTHYVNDPQDGGVTHYMEWQQQFHPTVLSSPQMTAAGLWSPADFYMITAWSVGEHKLQIRVKSGLNSCSVN